MNCIIIDDDDLSRKIIESYIKKVDFLKLVHSFQTAVTAMNTIKTTEDIHLIFLDIEMPEMSGIDFLNITQNLPQVIIISAKEQYALNAFEYDVTDYLLKPISYARFYRAVDKALQKFNDSQKTINLSDGIFIKKNNALVRVKFEDIYWIEALENYVAFNTLDEKVILHTTMKSVEVKLPPKLFARVHRSFIININKFHAIEDNAVIIKVGKIHKIIPIGKSYKDELLRDLNMINSQ